MPEPFLTVVMPIHGGAEWITPTLESLAAEPMGGVEIILIDSSPTPATAFIVETFADRLPLRMVQRPDMSPWQTKTNLGVEMATTDHVCILHHDDLWLPGRAQSVRRWIERNPEAALHLAPTRIIDRHGKEVGRWSCPLPPEQHLAPEFVLERLLVQNFISVPAVVFRRSAWLACGGMDADLWYTPDWDIWLKLASHGPVVYHEEYTTAFRVHGSSLTVTGSHDAAEFRKQMDIVLDRHLGQLPIDAQQRVERSARTAIDVNVSLAAASGGSLTAILQTGLHLLSLGPGRVASFLRDTRLYERVSCRLRAKLSGAF